MNDIVERLREADIRSVNKGWYCDLVAEAADEIERLKAALRELTEACGYVSPIAGAVAVKASVKDIRNAGRFMGAMEQARAALEGKP